MPTFGEQLNAMVDTPEKAKRLKKAMDDLRTQGFNPDTLQGDDRTDYDDTLAVLSRWDNGKGGVYLVPREDGDALSGLEVRGPISQRPLQGGEVTSPAQALGHGVGGAIKLGIHSLGLPANAQEAKRYTTFTNPDGSFSLPNTVKSLGAISSIAGIPQGGSMLLDTYDAGKGMVENYQQRRAAGESAIRASQAFEGAVAPMAPPIREGATNIGRPLGKVLTGQIPANEDFEKAYDSGGAAIATLLTIGNPGESGRAVRHADVPGNKILNPKGYTKRALSKAQRELDAASKHIERDYEPQYLEHGPKLVEEAKTQLAGTRADAWLESDPSKKARVVMNGTDKARATINDAAKMTKSEDVYRRKIVGRIRSRLSSYVDDYAVREERGDFPAEWAYEKYKKDGLPRNPEVVGKDAAEIHERAQQVLQSPEFAGKIANKETIINHLTEETIKKMAVPVGEMSKWNDHLRVIVEKAKERGHLTLEDYETLRQMRDGEYIVKEMEDGTPVKGKVELPPALDETVGYVERIKRLNGGELPGNVFDLNRLKSERYNEMSDRSFSKEITDDDKTRIGVMRGQAAGLRRLVDKMADDGTGRSMVADLNREYANAATVKEALTNYNLDRALSPPQTGIPMAGSAPISVGGIVRAGATGTGTTIGPTRSVRQWWGDPKTGVHIANAEATLNRMRGVSPPPPRTRAGAPQPGPFVPPARGPFEPTERPTPPPRDEPKPQKPKKTPGGGGNAASSAGPSGGGKPGPVNPIGPKPEPNVVKIEDVVNEMLKHAGKGNRHGASMGRLAKLWKQYGERAKAYMRETDVTWIEDKVNRHNANKSERIKAREARAQQQANPGEPVPPPTVDPNAPPSTAPGPIPADVSGDAAPPPKKEKTVYSSRRGRPRSPEVKEARNKRERESRAQAKAAAEKKAAAEAETKVVMTQEARNKVFRSYLTDEQMATLTDEQKIEAVDRILKSRLDAGVPRLETNLPESTKPQVQGVPEAEVVPESTALTVAPERTAAVPPTSAEPVPEFDFSTLDTEGLQKSLSNQRRALDNQQKKANQGDAQAAARALVTQRRIDEINKLLKDRDAGVPPTKQVTAEVLSDDEILAQAEREADQLGKKGIEGDEVPEAVVVETAPANSVNSDKATKAAQLIKKSNELFEQAGKMGESDIAGATALYNEGLKLQSQAERLLKSGSEVDALDIAVENSTTPPKRKPRKAKKPAAP